MNQPGDSALRIRPPWAAIILGTLLSVACSSLPDPSPTEFISYPTSEVLGKSKASIEQEMKPLKSKGDGWIQYTRTFSVRFDGDTAVEMIEKVPGELGCKDAAQWLGFTRARTPVLEKKRCVWPADSARHGLGKDLSGVLTLSDRVIHIKRARN